jgi:hypothetical protein
MGQRLRKHGLAPRDHDFGRDIWRILRKHNKRGARQTRRLQHRNSQTYEKTCQQPSANELPLMPQCPNELSQVN